MHLPTHYQLTASLELPDLSPLPRIRSERAATVAKWFGIDEQINHPIASHASDESRTQSRTDRTLLRSLLPKPGAITLLAGPSGAGKSSMLRALRRLRPRATFIDLNQIDPRDLPLVDCFDGAPLDQSLALLSHVGLAEAWSYLRTPSELSEGQRWRLKLALAMWKTSTEAQRQKGTEGKTNLPSPSCHRASVPSCLSPKTILLIDEFAALLDRVTACIVARCLRRTIDATPTLGAIVATSHDDLIPALVPETIVRCDFRLIEVWKRTEPGEIEINPKKPRRRRRKGNR